MTKKMTNKAAKCECGSGFMPTIMDPRRNRWACLKCREHGRDIRRRYAGSIYSMFFLFRDEGWHINADGVHIAGPFPSRDIALANLDAVAPAKG